MASPFSSSSSSTSPSPAANGAGAATWKFEVFLSFRGEDTRRNFTDHLYAALHRAGIETFKDDLYLARGKDISIAILEAIEGSRVSVIVFSRDYASSPWCLEELSKIYQCMKQGMQTVLPIFYGVDPSEVQELTGRYGEAFHKHQEAFEGDLEKVQKWRTALTELSQISGWDSRNRYESEFIEDVVEEIKEKLSISLSGITKGLVEIDSRVEEICLYLGRKVDDVRILGICGMGGVGKTTLARVVYEKMCCQFEGSSFLERVREIEEKHGIVPLQEQLLSEVLMEGNIRVWNWHKGITETRNRLFRKRILVVLDNVDKLEQLKSLAQTRRWFGNGSRIIIKSRDEDLLIHYGVDKIYMVEPLNHVAAVQLFCLKAFNNKNAPAEWKPLVEQSVYCANRIPLSLIVLGSGLCGRSPREWRSILEHHSLSREVSTLTTLKMAFGCLPPLEQTLLLDIGCLLSGEDRNFVAEVLEDCYSLLGIRILIQKSLISISNNRIWMHDLLQDMCREIVRSESVNEPGQRSRLWFYEDIVAVLTQNSGTNKVESIILDSDNGQDIYVSASSFSNLTRLRLLKVQNLQVDGNLEYLSNQIRYLQWFGYPCESFPPTFQPDKLVSLVMRCNNIKQFWKGTAPLTRLKVIDLSHSQYLEGTLDFHAVPNLEKLILEGCTQLSAVHPSIGVLEKLKYLNLKDCLSLVSLPDSIYRLESLEYLILRGCSQLEEFPKLLGKWNLRSLKVLDVSGTAIRQLPNMFGMLKRLELLDVSETPIRHLPSSVYLLRGLEVISCRGCCLHSTLPSSSSY